ncbi:MAG: hypothetical protein Q7J47_07370 [Azoarcus sp.]|nr:hypothetical protein [Azoarcus sp.]
MKANRDVEFGHSALGSGRGKTHTGILSFFDTRPMSIKKQGLACNPRTGLQVKNLARLDAAERGAVAPRATAFWRDEFDRA